MSYDPKVSSNILKRVRDNAKELYSYDNYPIKKQDLGIIRICPKALKRMANNLINSGCKEDELIEVQGAIMDLSDNEKDVFCYYTEEREE